MIVSTCGGLTIINWIRRYTVSILRSGRMEKNYWAWMSEIVEKSRRMIILDILDDYMLHSIRAVYFKEDIPVVRYVQDNCAIHTITIVWIWFENYMDVHKLDWPSRSTAFKPIENICTTIVYDHGALWDLWLWNSCTSRHHFRWNVTCAKCSTLTLWGRWIDDFRTWFKTMFTDES